MAVASVTPMIPSICRVQHSVYLIGEKAANILKAECQYVQLDLNENYIELAETTYVLDFLAASMAFPSRFSAHPSPLFAH